AMKELPEFRGIVENDLRARQLFETAKSIEGMSRNCGVHAAGVVISKEPLVDYIPLYRGNDGQAITAFEMGILEKIGMLKMDFLGLSNLTVLARCFENIHRSGRPDFSINDIVEGDTKAYAMLARGETTGVFQLEGGGMTRWVMQLKPSSIRELAAMVALYRPGPMEHIPRFIDTKFGRIKAEYLDERMKPILEETYGIIVYQDQVMQLVQALAGFSLGKADVLRRAMGKKDAKAMAEMKTEYMEGCLAGGMAEKDAEAVWQLLLPFAGYAFNKAHAVCYSILAYQTAWLKANYPVEYMAALLSVYLDKEDRVTACVEECRRQKITVLSPDVNCSIKDFSIENGKSIRFGLLAIKGVGAGIVEGIINDRAENGEYKHLFEFAERTKPYGMNRTALEALIRAGALDTIDKNRRKHLNHVDGALAYADQMNRSRLAGQDSLFGGDDSGPSSMSLPMLPEADMPSRSENLAMEKEVMGIYVSDHPLRGHERTVMQHCSHTVAQTLELGDNEPVKLAGVVAKLRTIVTKSEGKKMATIVLEDFTGQIGAIAFPATYEKLREVMQKDQVVSISGYVMHREMRGEKSVEIRLEDLKPLEASLELGAVDDAIGTVRVMLPKAKPTEIREFRRLVDEFPGDYELVLQITPETDYLPLYLTQHVNPTEVFLRAAKEKLTSARIEVVHNAREQTAA
ncbi:DNA polymerase III subunit alpha, partial [bacterium]